MEQSFNRESSKNRSQEQGIRSAPLEGTMIRHLCVVSVCQTNWQYLKTNKFSAKVRTLATSFAACCFAYMSRPNGGLKLLAPPVYPLRRADRKGDSMYSLRQDL